MSAPAWKDPFDRLLAAYLEELMSMSDDDVLDGNDPAAMQAAGLQMLDAAKAEAGRRRLAVAKAELARQKGAKPPSMVSSGDSSLITLALCYLADRCDAVSAWCDRAIQRRV